jgi:hypothetical protein
VSTNRADALLEEAAADFAAVDSGNGDQVALKGIAVKIDQAMRENPALTQTQVAERIGKTQPVVSQLLQELKSARLSGKPFRVEWKRGAPRGMKGDLERLARDQPGKLIEAAKQAIEQAPPDERKKLVGAMLDSSTVAGRVVENTVIERELAKKRAEAARKPEPSTTGIPIPLLYASICVQMTKWHQEMTRFTDDDLAELADGNPDGAEQVARVVDGVESQTQRWLSQLRPLPEVTARPELTVIEGKARRRTA